MTTVDFYDGKTILVTGGAGSIGSELVRKLTRKKPKSIRILDNNETGLFDLNHELQSDLIRPFVGDIRDKERLKIAMEDVDIVFHAAALKHVGLCEYNPFEAVKTNVVGTQNVIEIAREENVGQFMLISTDKAVDPVNVMGTTKLLAERLALSANRYIGGHKTIFSCVRFGNVLNSRGSVIPLFEKQIKNGGPLTITDPKMKRFVMSIPRAAELVLESAEIAQGGEVFILKMPVLYIGDLADVMREELDTAGRGESAVEVTIIGKSPMEKIDEILMTDDELERAFDINGLIIIPGHDVKCSLPEGATKCHGLKERVLTREEIKRLLRDNGGSPL